MLIAIDVGNTNIVIGGMEKNRTVFYSRINTDKDKTSVEYALLIKELLNLHGKVPADIDGGIVSSVVPQLRSVIADAVKMLTGINVLVVGSGIKTGLKIRVDDPVSVGSDIIVGAVAAKAIYTLPIAIVDMGTATTVVLIDKNGDYIGGMIIPGLWISLNALFTKTAQLPAIDISTPKSLLGKNTVDCMRSGSVIGYAAMIDGVLKRIEDELDSPVSAVITGGLSSIVAPYCEHKLHMDPELILTGLRLIYEKNKVVRRDISPDTERRQSEC